MFLLFSSITSQRNKSIESVLLFILGLFAGCSNENTSIMVISMTGFILFFEKNQRKNYFDRKRKRKWRY